MLITSKKYAVTTIDIFHRWQSLLNTEQSPRNLAHQGLPTHSSPMNTKWPQAAGIINVDELMRKSEALEM